RRIVPADLRYVGFDCPDVFVVGYGLDFDGAYRHLDHVAALDEADVAAARAAATPPPPDPRR
ncbi:MAG: hypoxanthine phosphoribosyltransferase, partial [Planctomycetaceae bacterium]